MNKTYYIYILECRNGSYYTGYTTDIKRRYEEHCNGSPKCKYTRSFPPIGIAACWILEAELSSVLQLERTIKQLTKTEKDQLVLMPATVNQFLSEDSVGISILQ